VAGPKAQGRRGADRKVYWHGVQGGRVALKERQLRVAKPRLRKKRRRADESGEVEVPAYTAPQANQGAGRPDAGAGDERGVDAPLRQGAAEDGRPGGDQVSRQSRGTPSRQGTRVSGGAGRAGPVRAGREVLSSPTFYYRRDTLARQAGGASRIRIGGAGVRADRRVCEDAGGRSACDEGARSARSAAGAWSSCRFSSVAELS